MEQKVYFCSVSNRNIKLINNANEQYQNHQTPKPSACQSQTFRRLQIRSDAKPLRRMAGT